MYRRANFAAPGKYQSGLNWIGNRVSTDVGILGGIAGKSKSFVNDLRNDAAGTLSRLKNYRQSKLNSLDADGNVRGYTKQVRSNDVNMVPPRRELNTDGLNPGVDARLGQDSYMKRIPSDITGKIASNTPLTRNQERRTAKYLQQANEFSYDGRLATFQRILNKRRAKNER